MKRRHLFNALFAVLPFHRPHNVTRSLAVGAAFVVFVGSNRDQVAPCFSITGREAASALDIIGEGTIAYTRSGRIEWDGTIISPMSAAVKTVSIAGVLVILSIAIWKNMPLLERRTFELDETTSRRVFSPPSRPN